MPKRFYIELILLTTALGGLVWLINWLKKQKEVKNDE